MDADVCSPLLVFLLVRVVVVCCQSTAIHHVPCSGNTAVICYFVWPQDML